MTIADACGLYLEEKNAHPDVCAATVKKYAGLLAYVRRFATEAPTGRSIRFLHEVPTAWCASLSEWLDGVAATRNGCPATPTNPRRPLSPVGKREIKQRFWSLIEYARTRTPALVPPDYRNPMSRELVGRKRSTGNGLSEPPVSTQDLVTMVLGMDRYQLGLLAPLILYGPRPSELGRILRSDLDLGNGLLSVRCRPAAGYRTKGKRDKTWPVTDALAACLRPFLAGDSIVLFVKRKHYEGHVRPFIGSGEESTLVAEHERRRTELAFRLGRALTKAEAEALSAEVWASAGAVDARDVARELERVAREARLAHVPTPKELRHLFESEAEAARLSPGVIRHLLGHAPLRGDALVHYNHTGRAILREQVAVLDGRRIELVEALLRRAQELDAPPDAGAIQAVS